MELRIRDTGQVMTESEFRSLHPNTSFPPQLTVELLDSFGADPVLNGPQAQPTRYQVAFRDGVEEINGKWFTKYSAADMDADAIAAVDAAQAKSVRDDRNKRLSDSDWTQIEDAPVDKQAWATYRQALRDLTAQADFPWEVEWPEQPQ
jgi:hypothetical protein